MAAALLFAGCHTVPPAPGSQPPSGYAFDKPQLLTQQLIWGIGHGVRLLAEACQRRGDDSATAAYFAWHAAQQARLDAAQRDLARHYFAADQATTAQIDAALMLPPTLASHDAALGPACATLAEALAKPRYDLEKYYAARRAAILKGDPAFPGAVWDEPPASDRGQPAAAPPAAESSAATRVPEAPQATEAMQAIQATPATQPTQPTQPTQASGNHAAQESDEHALINHHAHHAGNPADPHP